MNNLILYNFSHPPPELHYESLKFGAIARLAYPDKFIFCFQLITKMLVDSLAIEQVDLTLGNL